MRRRVYCASRRLLGGNGSVVSSNAHDPEIADRLERILGVLHGEAVGDTIPVHGGVVVPELDGARGGRGGNWAGGGGSVRCLLYTSPSPRDSGASRMPS